MTKDDFLKLYEKFQRDQCNPDEKKLLALYRDEFVLTGSAWDEAAMGDRDETGRLIYNGIETGMQIHRTKRVRPLFSSGLKVAAVLLPLIIAGIYLWRGTGHPGKMPATAQPHAVPYDVPPGGNKAVLTLANGSSIVLDNAQNGLLSQQGNAKVMKTGDGQLSYIKAKAADNTVTYNKISTPRGGQYKVLLPDGSRVWLNSSSSLSFPTAFTGDERKVTVTGEAYFEIARNTAQPFKVSVPGPAGRSLDIAVLGTAFDVMAYEEEDAVRTTLIEGAVKLEKDGLSWQLRPGQQGALGEGNRMNVADDADLDAVTAWKNGRFEFRGNIKGIMRQIARWYDVEVVYEGDVSDKRYNVATSRAANVSEALNYLALTGSIHFTIEGKKITVISGPAQ